MHRYNHYVVFVVAIFLNCFCCCIKCFQIYVSIFALSKSRQKKLKRGYYACLIKNLYRNLHCLLILATRQTCLDKIMCEIGAKCENLKGHHEEFNI